MGYSTYKSCRGDADAATLTLWLLWDCLVDTRIMHLSVPLPRSKVRLVTGIVLRAC